MTDPVRDVRELLAEYAHEAWSGWMKYLFEKCELGAGGSVVMPDWAVKRWARQANTKYADLSPEEKESDRTEADRMLAIVRTPPPAVDAGGSRYEKDSKIINGLVEQLAPLHDKGCVFGKYGACGGIRLEHNCSCFTKKVAVDAGLVEALEKIRKPFAHKSGDVGALHFCRVTAAEALDALAAHTGNAGKGEG